MTFCIRDAIAVPAALPSDPEERAAFCQLVTDLLANPKAKPGAYRHQSVPLVHHAVRTQNLPALKLLGRGGVDLNKPFREVVEGIPAKFSLTPLDEAILRDDADLVWTLFSAGLDPWILDQPELDKRPYRALLRSGKEPSIEVVSTLLDVLAHVSERQAEHMTRTMVSEFVRWKRPFHTLVAYLLDRIQSDRMRVLLASSTLTTMAKTLGRDRYPSFHRFVPILLDAGAAVEPVVLVEIVQRMRRSPARTKTLNLLLDAGADPHAWVETGRGPNGAPRWATACLTAIGNGDEDAIDRFIGTGQAGEASLRLLKTQVDENAHGWVEWLTAPGIERWKQPGRQALLGVRRRMTVLEGEELALVADAAVREVSGATSVPDRVRARL